MSGYWWERDPDQYADELEAMRLKFPDFKLGMLPDNRKYWDGHLCPGITGWDWKVRVVYSHWHPDASGHAGSVRSYTLEPWTLDELVTLHPNGVPHLIRDTTGRLCMCTTNQFNASGPVIATAATVLGWTAKWLGFYESWRSGNMTWERFSAG